MKMRVRSMALVVLPAVLAGAVQAAGLLPAAASGGGQISTVAGGPGRGPARNVAQQPVALATGPGGTAYVASAGAAEATPGAVRALSTTSTHETVTAGGGSQTPANALKASLAALDPAGVAVDAAGNVIVSDDSVDKVLVVAASSGHFYGRVMTAGRIYVIAGNGSRGYAGDGRLATAAELDFPHGVAVGAGGNVLIADYDNHAIRVVAETSGTFFGQAMTAGDIYTVAGNGTPSVPVDGVLGTSAGLDFPQGVAADAAGNLVIADTGNSQIRIVADASGTFYGRAMTAGDIYTVAGSSTEGFAGDGGPATSAKLAFPAGVTVDAAGNLIIADTASSRIRVVAPAAGTFYGQAMTGGDIYTVAGDGTRGYRGDGGPATSAKLREPDDVAVGQSGSLLIADTGNSRIRLVAVTTSTLYGRAVSAGNIYTIAGNGLALSGNGGPALSAELALHPNPPANFPAGLDFSGLAASPSGSYAVYDRAEVRLVAAASGTFFGRPMTAGDIYGLAGDGRPGYSGDGGPGPAATVGNGGGLAFDPSGNLVVADTDNHVVRVVAATSGTFYGQPMTAGGIYTVAGDGGNGFSGNTGLATSAKLSSPDGVAVDGAGNLVIADTDSLIRFSPGQVRVVAESAGTFYGQAMTAGHIYGVAGSYARDASTANGVPATSAKLPIPAGLAVDAAGNLVVAESFLGNQIRVLAAQTGTFYGQAMQAGDIYTIASASLPVGVALDQAGNVIIGTFFGDAVDVLAAATGTFYGQSMVAGNLYKVATGGGALPGITGPEGVATDPAGDILYTDDGTGRIRAISP